MEYFVAESSTTLDTALRELRKSDVVLFGNWLQSGFPGSGDSGITYTQAEYSEAVALGKPVLVFLKYGKKSPRSRRTEWLNQERSRAKEGSCGFSKRGGG